MAEPLSRPRAHALLHVTVALWGLTAILGKTITVGALALVFYRVTIVAVLMAAIMFRRGVSFRLSTRRALEFFGAGTIVALHWIFFYGAVKTAGVAIAVLCLSTLSFFTALIEPIFFRRRVRASELLLGAFVVLGVVLIVRMEVHGTAVGYAMGIASSFFSAAFGAWNGHLMVHERSERVTFFELSSAAVVCGLVFVPMGGFVAPWNVTPRDWALLAFLSVACTLLPWLWTLRVVKTLSPYTISLAIALEPVYSIVLAYALWPGEERLTPRFYVGSSILLALIVVNAWLKERFAPPRPA
ncbi:MAG: DMT family transporter [Polyangiaceae bacterium]